MKSTRACLAVWILPLLLPIAGPPGARAADMEGQVRAVLANPVLARAQVGVHIVRLGDSPRETAVVYSLHAEQPLIPASNLKLVTTSAALDKLGADFKFRTRLLQRGDDLALIGDGDPTLGDVELLRKVGWDTTTLFRQWAEGLKKMGLVRVGNVLVDDGVFDDTFVHPNWPANQLHKRYEAPVGGLNLNANCVDFHLDAVRGQIATFSIEPDTHYVTVQKNGCVGGSYSEVSLTRRAGSNEIVLTGETPAGVPNAASVTIFDPPLFAGTVLAETLQAGGVAVGGKVVRDRTIRASIEQAAPATAPGTAPAAASCKLLAVHETPIAQALARANKDSMNLYAECLCKRLGYAASGKSGSWENGPAAVGAFLKRAGVPEAEFRLDDGCGLSKENAVSASAIVHVLMYDHCGKNRDAFLASLSVAGQDGTLEHRFEAADLRDLRGRVYGKSGFVEGVSTLSGFLHARDDRWYAFSILMNQIPSGSNSSVKPLQEAIIRALDASVTGHVAAGQ